MIRSASLLLGATAGGLYIRERRARIAVERLGSAALETLLKAIDANNPDTGEHVRRVADYSLLLADAADVDEKMQHSIERVALFHDIGKIDGAITDIISETTRLTPAEKRAVKKHPQSGAEVLRPLATFYPDLPEGVLAHHERWDGTGYPKKLRGTRIPLAARIVAIADTFDAVTHSRSYSQARSLETATGVIADGRGTQFDPDLVDLFLSPFVMDSVKKRLREACKPRKRSGRRRRTPHENAPDLSFRWRTTAPSQQTAGR